MRNIFITAFYITSILFSTVKVEAQSVSTDDFDNIIHVKSIEFGEDIRGISDVDFGYAFIRTVMNRKTKSILFHQLYVTNTYKYGWRFWNRATSSDGVSLEFTKIDSEVDYSEYYSSIMYSEDFAVTLPISQVKKYKNSGYKIKIYSKSGTSVVINLSSTLLIDHLNRVDSVRVSK